MKIATLIVLAIVASACTLPEATGPEDPANSVFALEVGDCFIAPVAAEIDTIARYECTEPHDDEVYAIFDVKVESFNFGEIGAIADKTCIGRFEDYVGIPYEDSIYEYSWLAPTAQSWDEGDRAVTCIAYQVNKRLTESVLGSAR